LKNILEEEKVRPNQKFSLITTALNIAEEMAAETIGYEQLIAALENFDVNELATIVDRTSILLKMMSSESVHNMLISIIQQEKKKEEKQDIWQNSLFKDLVKLQSNNVGNVGEQLLNEICKSSGIDADCNGSKTKQIGGGEGDGKIMGIPIEIKTALQGSSSPSFQHELGEVPWKGGTYMIFVDIAPECIYLTIFKNFTEETYKSKKKLLCFPTKTITWRKGKGAFKLDTSVKINEMSVENRHAIKITRTTSNDDIASFIKDVIV